MTIQAVVFDLYDTLIQITSKRNAFHGLLASIKDREARSAFVHLLFTKNCSRLERILPALQEFDEQAVDSFMRNLQEDLASTVLFNDTMPTLEAIKSKGLKIGVITNLATPYKEPFYSLGLKPFADKVIFSCDVGTVKPDRSIYIMMCRKLGIAPEDILMVGDSVYCDYLGPMSVGMQAALLDRNNKHLARDRVTSLTEVLSLI